MVIAQLACQRTNSGEVLFAWGWGGVSVCGGPCGGKLLRKVLLSTLIAGCVSQLELVAIGWPIISSQSRLFYFSEAADSRISRGR
jgi:hypothetical protein